MRPMQRCLWAVVAVVVLGGCGERTNEPTEAPAGLVREHWQLSHSVPESRTVRVVGQSLSGYSESTRASFSTDRSGDEVTCTVTFSVPGWGGPENKVGDKLPTTVQGRPAVRNGAGAEGDYLIWQRPDGTWAQSICDGEGQRATRTGWPSSSRSGRPTSSSRSTSCCPRASGPPACSRTGAQGRPPRT